MLPDVINLWWSCLLRIMLNRVIMDVVHVDGTIDANSDRELTTNTERIYRLIFFHTKLC